MKASANTSEKKGKKMNGWTTTKNWGSKLL